MREREREREKGRDDGRDGGVWVYPTYINVGNPLMRLLGVTLSSAISIKLVFSLSNGFHSSTWNIHGVLNGKSTSKGSPCYRTGLVVS